LEIGASVSGTFRADIVWRKAIGDVGVGLVMRGRPGRGASGWSAGALTGVALAVIVCLGFVAQIVTANILNNFGDASRYGRFYIPGSKVLMLPAGSLELLLSQHGVTLQVPPKLTVSVSPTHRSVPAPIVKRDRGSRFGSSGQGAQSFVRVWSVQVSRSGEYRVTAGGANENDLFRLNLGHGPPLSSSMIWLLTGIAAAAAVLLWLLARVIGRLRTRRQSVTSRPRSRRSGPRDGTQARTNRVGRPRGRAITRAASLPDVCPCPDGRRDGSDRAAPEAGRP
jgi:hypothetical protein